MNHNLKSQNKGQQDERRQFASFFLDDTICGIDISVVQEINEDLAITKVPLAPDYVEGIMNLRGQIVTIINQGMKLGLRPSRIDKNSRVIIVKSKDEYIGLLVDRIQEVVSVPVRAITEAPSNIKGVQGRYFSGIYHTEKNELMAILNVEEVLG